MPDSNFHELKNSCRDQLPIAAVRESICSKYFKSIFSTWESALVAASHLCTEI